MERWKLYAFAAALFAGLTSTIAKSGLKTLGADLGLAVRTVFVFGFAGISLFVIGCGRETNLGALADEKITGASSPAHKITISGTVTQTDSHCGGVAPTEEMLKKLATPRAFPGKKFHVIRGDTNTLSHEIVLSFITGENGDFSFLL